MTHATEQPPPTHVLGDADFAAPQHNRWFEDYQAGAVYEYGWASVTEEEIISFARQWDPQPMHIDTGWAATGPSAR